MDGKSVKFGAVLQDGGRSGFRKYRDICYGNASFARVLRAELVMILCNGTKVVLAVQKTLSACGLVRVSDQFTSAEYARDDLHLFVINSGFIGRIDNFAKRRLGMEIEQIAEKAGVQL